MKLLGILLFIGVGLLIAWVYYFFLRISIAIWFPKKAKKEWLALAETPGLALSYPFFKWVAPVWVVIVPVSVFLSVVKYVLLGGQ